MIHVIATVKLKQGTLEEALAIYRDFVPLVLAGEPGCLEYAPTVDIASNLANQVVDCNQITVRERWRTLDDFRAHIEMPHAHEFRAQIKDILAAAIVLRVTRDAF